MVDESITSATATPTDECSVTGCSDDDKYEITLEDMVEVYTRIANGDFELDCKLVRIRSPTPESNEPMPSVEKREEVLVNEISQEKNMAMEFDFDICNDTSKMVTPRRTLGSSKTPRSTQKRVAQWDKIMNDYKKHHKLDDIESSREVSATPSSTSTGSILATSVSTAASAQDALEKSKINDTKKEKPVALTVVKNTVS